MIGLDTNLLVRFLVNDEPDQAARAAAFVDRAVSRHQELYVSDLVMCEVVWVLAGAYRIGRGKIAETVADLLRSPTLRFTDSDRLSRALRAFARGKGDFADCLILEHARDAGCTAVATFDRALLKEPGFLAP